MRPRPQEHVAGFSIEVELSLGQKLRLLTGSKLVVDIGALCERSPGRMRVQARSKVVRSVARATGPKPVADTSPAAPTASASGPQGVA